MAQILMELLLREDVKQMSMGALQQVNLDVIQCERKLCFIIHYSKGFQINNFFLFTEFAASEPVPGFEDGTLISTFYDLRQLLDLLLSCDYSAYFADYGQEASRYQRVSPQRAIIVLEKYVST